MTFPTSTPHEVLEWAETAEISPEKLETELCEYIDSRDKPVDQDVDRSKAAFIGSLLLDVLRVGGNVAARESTLRFAWPDWEGPNGRDATRKALLSTKENQPLCKNLLTKLSRYFVDGIEGDTLAAALPALSFRLVQIPPDSTPQQRPSDVSQTNLEDEPPQALLPLKELFDLSLRHWSMPYRGRTGRNRRYVILATRATNDTENGSPTFDSTDCLSRQAADELFRNKNSEVVAGILELGDEAPFCPWRDDLLGLSPTSFCNWIHESPLKNLSASIERLATFRKHIKEEFAHELEGLDLRICDAAALVFHDEHIGMISGNRSVESGPSETKGNEQADASLPRKKALNYALRLARGEEYLQRVLERLKSHLGLNLTNQASDLAISEQPVSSNKFYDKEANVLLWSRIDLDTQRAGLDLDSKHSQLISGVRAIHDILLPRVHMEATVLGAVPPFSDALGGKLVISFLSHPAVVSAPMYSDGSILWWTFERELENYLVDSGALCITTKGLYSGHSALYNRASLPGHSGSGSKDSLKLQHIANTGGATTSLISSKTAKFAWEINELDHTKDSKDDPSQDFKGVSGDYGTGGAKRHRVLEHAARYCGIPSNSISAGIRRPVYGVQLVHNAPAVCWTGCEPAWRIRFPPVSSCKSDESESLTEKSGKELRAEMLHSLSSATHFAPKPWDKHATTFWQIKWLNKLEKRLRDTPYIPGLIELLPLSGKESSAP